MKTGLILKNKLGLSKLKYIKIYRSLATSAYRTYMVFFDSRYPNTPLTSSRVTRNPMPSDLFIYPFNSALTHTPPIEIEDFAAPLESALFFVVDLAGYLGNDTLRESKSEIKSFLYGKIGQLTEGLTISDIKSSAVSQRNKDFLNKRRKEGESGSTLEKVFWDEEFDTILLEFHSATTYGGSLNYDAEGNSYNSNFYTVQIIIEEPSKYIGTKQTFKEFTPSEQGKLVLDMLDNAEVKIWSSDPSWLFQSSWEYFSDAGASPYDLPVPKGQDIWAKRHTGTTINGLHVSKHVLEVLQVVKNNYSDIAKGLRG